MSIEIPPTRPEAACSPRPSCSPASSLAAIMICSFQAGYLLSAGPDPGAGAADQRTFTKSEGSVASGTASPISALVTPVGVQQSRYRER